MDAIVTYGMTDEQRDAYFAHRQSRWRMALGEVVFAASGRSGFVGRTLGVTTIGSQLELGRVPLPWNRIYPVLMAATVLGGGFPVLLILLGLVFLAATAAGTAELHNAELARRIFRGHHAPEAVKRPSLAGPAMRAVAQLAVVTAAGCWFGHLAWPRWV